MTRLGIGPVVLAAAWAAVPSTAWAGDVALRQAVDGRLLAADAAAARMSASSPSSVQASYDAARDMQEAVHAAAGVSPRCRALFDAASRYARARVLQAEGVDRPDPRDTERGRAAAAAARAQVTTARPGCATRGGRRPARLAVSPASGEAFLGPVVARVPRGADRAVFVVNGRELGTVGARGGYVRATFAFAPGRYDITLRYLAGATPRGSTRVDGALLLPRSARLARPGSAGGPAMQAVLDRAAASGPAYRAAWVQDLATGRAAGVQSTAAFPAASTVKLGLVAGAMVRLGARPEESPLAYDLRAVMGWSSNLAANRLSARLGQGTAADGLRRLGATQSTYTGDYIVGTELQPTLPGGATISPPRVSGRVTSARDLGRMMYAIHAAAVGAPGARQ